MTNPNDPAFPQHPERCEDQGLTKREYVAAQALKGILSNPYFCSLVEKKDPTKRQEFYNVLAIQLADGLIAKLSEGDE